jgi:SpoVK/Ycf46/Vps4 family AAA+-type ATPase
VRVTLREFEKEVFVVSDELRRKLDAGEVCAGATLLVCEQRRMAFDALPNPDGLSHFKFLVKDPPPDVLVERDIGAPPKFIDELTEHLVTEMTRPELSRRYKLRRSAMTLLTGVSGSGKTLSILGFWRRMYDVMSELTGVPVDELPPRVVRVRPSQALSKWLGESDKLVDRFFDEIEQLAGEKWTAPDGREHELPVFAIMEECDGMARARGEDSIHDRIQTTLLQRLDVTSQRLRNQLVILVFSTNVPHVVDPAFLRRAGGTVERFGRLGKRAFQAVLDKHLTGLPFRRNNGCDDETLKRRVAAELCGWMFGPEAQQHGLVELNYVGSSHPVVKHRKDFLTGALVDRSVQQAAIAARKAEREGVEAPGVTAAGLIRAFDAQIRSTVDQLRAENVREHVDLPDGVRVATLRRLEQPAVLPFELHRAS